MSLRSRLALVVAVVVALAGTACVPPGGGPGPGHGGGHGGHGSHGDRAAEGPVAPLASDGRWLTDATGRVVTLHGVNEVEKAAPYYPAAAGFDADDARFLAEHGFTVVRLGVVVEGLMPQPGQIDSAYIENLAASVRALARERIFVLLDFHQDGFAPKYNGNGLPDWMAIDDGLPNPPDAVFPLYYIQNPAMQRAFESFWANRPGPDGVGVQDAYIAGVTAVARRFAGNRYILGYELMNEPWPGAVWEPCLTDPAGCARLEQQLMVPFQQRATAAIRRITRTQQVYVEPFVLFNFGQVGTTLPGAGLASGTGRDRGTVLSFHSYAVDVAGEEGVVANALAAAERDQVPPVATEFGATVDVPTLQRLTGQLDNGLISWMFWHYQEDILPRDTPASLDNVRSLEAFRSLVRPYPAALTGTPTGAHFDPASRTYDLTYATRGPSGQRYRSSQLSVISVPELQYPDGYTVEVTGARVVSRPCAAHVTLRNLRRSDVVTVSILPGGGCG
jgi:endoglycosylceramidase